MIFHQLFEKETSTYTYLMADPETREAVLIDPVLETIDRDLKLIQELGLKLLYVIDTHIHADHITSAGEIRKRTGVKTAVSHGAKVDCADITLKEGSILKFGKYSINVFETPGHTDSCISLYCQDRVFTGDTLLIRGKGRTDFQQGSSERLYDSVHKKLFTLPPGTKVYPAHDYNGQTSSTIEMEMAHNPRVGKNKTKAEFIETMKNLKLSLPQKINQAVPANMACGSERQG